MRKIGVAVLALLLMISGAVPASAATGRRVIVYYQTIFNGSTYVSPLTLTSHNTGVTDVLVGAIHLDANSVVHLNDDTLSRDRGAQISWFNTQFYCGWGSLANTSGYDSIIRRGIVPASKVVAGTVTNPANCSGFVSMSTLKSTVRSLVSKYPTFGGID